MTTTLENFSNERYLILKLLREHQVNIKGESYISLSQQEIADIAHFSKSKTNRILHELISIGCIINYQDKRSKYALTDKGFRVLEIIETTKIW